MSSLINFQLWFLVCSLAAQAQPVSVWNNIWADHLSSTKPALTQSMVEYLALSKPPARALLMWPAITTDVPSSASVAAKEFASARQSWNRNNWRPAFDHANRCLSSAPELWPCLEILGKSASKLMTLPKFSEHLRLKYQASAERPSLAVALASFALSSRKVEDARIKLDEVLLRARALRDEALEMWALYSIADSWGITAQHYPQQLAALESALSIASAIGTDHETVPLRFMMAGTSAVMGDVSRATQLLSDLQAEATSKRWTRLQPSISFANSELAARQGKWSDAIQNLNVVLAHAQANNDVPDQINLLTRLAGLHLNSGDFQTAKQMALNAVRADSKLRHPAQRAHAFRSLENIALQSGDFGAALTYGLESIRLFRSVQNFHSAGAGYGNIAYTQRLLGDLSAAIRSLQLAIESAKRLNDFGEQERLQIESSALALERGQISSALKFLDNAERLNRGSRNKRFRLAALQAKAKAYLSLHQTGQVRWIVEEAKTLAVEGGLDNAIPGLSLLEALSLVQSKRRTEGQTRLQALADSPDSTITTETQLDASLALCQTSLSGLSAAESWPWCKRALNRFDALHPTIPGNAMRRSFQQRFREVHNAALDALWRLHQSTPSQSNLQQAFRIMESMKYRTLLLQTGRSTSPTDGIVSLADAQLLASSRRLSFLHFAITQKSLHVLEISPTGTNWWSSPWSSVWDSRVTQLRLLVSQQNSGTLSSLCAMLGRKLLASRANQGGESPNLILSLDGVLFELPFDLLSLPSGQSLMDQYAVSLTPNATWLIRALKMSSTINSSSTVLAFGASITQTPTMRHISRLPGATSELNHLTSLFPQATLRAGPQATRKQLLLDLASKPNLIHFAGHAQPQNGIQLSSETRANADSLTAADVEFLSLSNTWVILAGCSTGLAAVQPGEGLLGFVRAFLAAGSSGVVFSRWEVDDNSTRDFMTRFHRKLAAGIPFSIALWKTKLEIRSLSSNIPAYRLPFFWSAFDFAGSL